ncbi:MAG: VRR-NUC domain-containing protein [Cyclobacteriaceae bacterium]
MPEKYYLDYFTYLLDFVEKQYEHVLDEPEYLFYQSFRDLSEDAKCLYLRFSNRRGDFFRINKISYSEITDLHGAKEELVHHSFVRINENDDVAQFKLFTKAELIGHFDFLHKSQKKDELLLELSELDTQIVHESEEIVEVLKNEEVEFIKLLFFGYYRGRMTDFVIRDVGNVKIEKLDETKFKPWFQSREEALAVLHISQFRRLIYEVQEAELPLDDFINEIPWEEWLKHPRSAKSAEKLLLKIAYYFEQLGELEQALEHYSFTERHPARERKVRILEKLERKQEALEIAKAILDKPANATELTFATDYLNRSGVRINRSMTERLKGAPSISLVKDPEVKVEQATIEYFEEQGWSGFHAENFLWRGIFGLVFWEEIFDESHGSFHQPLQRQPSDLNDNVFFESRAHLLEAKLKSFSSRKKMTNHIANLYEQKDGIANRFVTWHESLLPSILTMIEKVPLKGLKEVLLEMSKDMKENSAGFPDLFLWNETTYQFYEVKSPNDHLSAQQLFWLGFLEKCKIKVDVLRVNYLN